MENAKKVGDAALAEARKNNKLMVVAIVDTRGNLLYYAKIDNTQLGSAKVCVNKARSAVLFKRPTKAFQDNVAAGGKGTRILGIENAVPLEGGLPIVVDGKIIGAIGVSGDLDHDGQSAAEGLSALK